MSLNKIQYEALIREYEEKQLHSKHELERRIREVNLHIPEIAKINAQIAALSVSKTKELLTGNSFDVSAYKKDLNSLIEEKERLLIEHKYPSNYLTEQYTCTECKDTGYIDGEKCKCFKKSIIDVLYQQSNIKELLDKENFSTFSFHYYSDQGTNSATGISPQENIKKVVSTCKDFIRDFSQHKQNLFFYGETGVGKTFLTNCIAKEIIDQAYSTLYFSAIKLFELLANATFRYEKGDLHGDYILKHIYECDLLIIDDLGTELTNSFTSSALFNCINERFLNNKSTIISTNYSIENLKNNYSERIFSRITSNYTLLKIYGDDIRVKKKLEE